MPNIRMADSSCENVKACSLSDDSFAGGVLEHPLHVCLVALPIQIHCNDLGHICRVKTLDFLRQSANVL